MNLVAGQSVSAPLILLDTPRTPEEFLPGLALATAIGLLIGAERGWRMREEEPGKRVAGIRTFAIVGLLGGIVGMAMSFELAMIAAFVAIGTIATLVIGYLAEMRTEAHLSATSTIAATVTLLLGALATTGQMALGAVGAGVMVALLASRDSLHGLLDRTSQAEMTALVRLALVVFLVWPLLPDAPVGPYGGINLRRIWFVVVVVGSVSFAGYVLVRWLGGGRGTLLMALVGALVSSTAVTLEAARRIREQGANSADDAAIAVASLVMLVRVMVLTLVLASPVAGEVFWLLLPATFATIAWGAWQVRLTFEPGPDRQPSVKPPSLAIALLFAGLVAVLTMGVRWAEHSYGGGSGAFIIAIGGMLDVDSAIAAVGALPRGALPAQFAALAIAASVLFNTMLKLFLLASVAGLKRTLSAGASLSLTAFAIVGAAITVLI